MDYEAIEVSRFLTDFKPLIHKTLQRLNIHKRHMDYDDFYQELQIHLLTLRENNTANLDHLDDEAKRYMFTAYAGKGLYWHGLNLIKKNSKAAYEPIEEGDMDWLNQQQVGQVLSDHSRLALENFFQQAKERLSEADYLLLLYLADERYDIDTIADLMQVSRSTIYQRKTKIQERLAGIKNCLTD